MRTIHYLSDIIEKALKSNPNHDPSVPKYCADVNNQITTGLIEAYDLRQSFLPLNFFSSNTYADSALPVNTKVKAGDYLQVTAALTETKYKNHSYYEVIVWQYADGSEWVNVVKPTWIAIRDGSKLKTWDTKDYAIVPRNCVGFYVLAFKSGYNFTYEDKLGKKPSHVNQFNLMNVIKFNVASK